MDGLVQAVALDQYGDIDPVIERRFLLEIGNNFIPVTRSDRVKYAHRSAREFLVQSLLRNSQREAITLRSAHAQASGTCLAFLVSLKDDSKWGYLPNDGREDAKGLNFSSFEMYGYFFWASHYEKAEVKWKFGKGQLTVTTFFETTAAGKDGLVPATPLSKMDQSLVASYEYKSSFRKADTIGLQDAISCPPHPLFTECIWGFESHVLEHVRCDPQLISARNHRGKSRLYRACENGHSDIVRILLRKWGRC